MRHRYPTALALAFGLLCLLAASPGQAQDPQLALTPFISSGLTQPIDLTHAGDGSGRLFVNEKTGAIKIFDATGAPLGTFLDISSLITTNGERGLLGLAFAPDYASSRRFYINYTNLAGNTVIARYTASASNPNVANTTGEILLTIPQPFSNHNGGDIAFGPNGLLYVASGDGGSGNDPQANSQNLNSLLGKILRLDVSGATGYTPAGGYPGAAPEVFAVGLRNPWRMSFDRLTGDLYIGDVGQGAREEIDRIPAGSSGLNFGWVCYEGSRDNRSVASAAASNCQAYSTYTPPFFEYTHSLGQSVTGGIVYRGAQYPALQGYYIFADYRTDRLWAVRDSASTQSVYVYPGGGSSLVGFGESESGEAFAISIFGEISRVTSTVPLPVTLTEFYANTDDCDVAFRWASATEQNFSHYQLETSPDGRAWTAVAKTPGGQANYAFTTGPDAPKGYARLLMVDRDGSVAYSPIVSWATACAKTWQLGPNPVVAGQDVRVRNLPSGETLLVVDATGREVARRSIGGLDASTLDLSTAGWPTGVYAVRIGEQVERLVVAQ